MYSIEDVTSTTVAKNVTFRISSCSWRERRRIESRKTLIFFPFRLSSNDDDDDNHNHNTNKKRE